MQLAPSKMITSYEKKTLWRDIGHNVFTGLPRPEFDQAWHQLLSRTRLFMYQDLKAKTMVCSNGHPHHK
jgi:muconolactone delta-isomerase